MPEIQCPDGNSPSQWDEYCERWECEPDDCRACGIDCDERLVPPMSLHGEFLFRLGSELAKARMR